MDRLNGNTSTNSTHHMNTSSGGSNLSSEFRLSVSSAEDGYFIALWCLFLLACLLLTGLVIFSVKTIMEEQTAYVKMLIHLCIALLLYSVTYFIVVCFHVGKENHNFERKMWARALGVGVRIGYFTSMFLEASMSIELYYFLNRALQYDTPSGLKRARILIASSWSLATVLAILYCAVPKESDQNIHLVYILDSSRTWWYLAGGTVLVVVTIIIITTVRISASICGIIATDHLNRRAARQFVEENIQESQFNGEHQVASNLELGANVSIITPRPNSQHGGSCSLTVERSPSLCSRQSHVRLHIYQGSTSSNACKYMDVGIENTTRRTSNNTANIFSADIIVHSESCRQKKFSETSRYRDIVSRTEEASPTIVVGGSSSCGSRASSLPQSSEGSMDNRPMAVSPVETLKFHGECKNSKRQLQNEIIKNQDDLQQRNKECNDERKIHQEQKLPTPQPGQSSLAASSHNIQSSESPVNPLVNCWTMESGKASSNPSGDSTKHSNMSNCIQRTSYGRQPELLMNPTEYLPKAQRDMSLMDFLNDTTVSQGSCTWHAISGNDQPISNNVSTENAPAQSGFTFRRISKIVARLVATSFLLFGQYISPFITLLVYQVWGMLAVHYKVWWTFMLLTPSLTIIHYTLVNKDVAKAIRNIRRQCGARRGVAPTLTPVT